MKPTIFRYRTNFSSGTGPWEYTDKYYYEEDIRADCESEYDYSEHYRGCDIEVVTFPPLEWAQKRVKAITSDIKYQQSLLEYYQAYIEGVK